MPPHTHPRAQVLIRDRTAFETKVIPKFFKHSNLPSFVRQLNV